MVDRPRNRDVVVLAIAALGGESKFVHTEDIAIKCHELAPDSFSWTKHTEFPELEIARRVLYDVRSSEFGALVEGRSGQGSSNRAEDGWRLTASGREWIKVEGEAVEDALRSTALSDRRQRVLQQLRRIYKHRAWSDFENDPDGFGPSVGVLAELVRVRVDAPTQVWQSRFDELHGKAALIRDEALLRFVKRCRSIYESRRS